MKATKGLPAVEASQPLPFAAELAGPRRRWVNLWKVGRLLSPRNCLLINEGLAPDLQQEE